MDAELFHAINHLAGHYDGIDDGFETIAQFAPFALVALLLGLWFWPGERAGRDERQWSVIAATISATLALGINQVIIRMWERPRPFAAQHAVLLLKPSHDPSFPSDHSTFAFAVAVSVLLATRRAGVPALVIAAILGFSRVYVGEHYVGDVVAGVLIGTAVAVAVYQLRPFAMPLIDPPMRLARRMRLG
jgi:undecaprenyl-diphosphatase